MRPNRTQVTVKAPGTVCPGAPGTGGAPLAWSCRAFGGSPVKIAGMVLWIVTAGIGVYLLAAGIAAQRAAAGAGARESEPAPSGPANRDLPGSTAGTLPGGAVAYGVIPASGPVTETPVDASSALLEFTHPLIAMTGLTFWIFFVMTSDRLFARVALVVVMFAVLAGLTWVIRSRRAAAGKREATAHAFPPHLVVLHGAAAAATLALVVVTALTAAPH